jgi:hypothetical protein
MIASKAEGMPRVMLEAFSAGVPVVAFPVGGIPEVIVDGETGFLVHERTSQALAARIREIILLGQGPLQRVANQARREWERKYTVEVYRRNVTAMMESLASDRPRVSSRGDNQSALAANRPPRLRWLAQRIGPESSGQKRYCAPARARTPSIA